MVSVRDRLHLRRLARGCLRRHWPLLWCLGMIGRRWGNGPRHPTPGIGRLPPVTLQRPPVHAARLEIDRLDRGVHRAVVVGMTEQIAHGDAGMRGCRRIEEEPAETRRAPS